MLCDSGYFRNILITFHRTFQDMTHAEQHRLIVDLMDSMARMSRADEEVFDMFQKRDHDDEDLDDLSRRRLVALHEKYVRPRNRN
jgi:hypothetical protein